MPRNLFVPLSMTDLNPKFWYLIGTAWNLNLYLKSRRNSLFYYFRICCLKVIFYAFYFYLFYNKYLANIGYYRWLNEMKFCLEPLTMI